MYTGQFNHQRKNVNWISSKQKASAYEKAAFWK